MNNNIVIYTCRTGGYDDLLQPLVVDNSFDYICFTDNLKEERRGVWVFREIPRVIDDKQRLSRYPKMFPHVLLPEYEYSVYIDANILIQNQAFYEYLKQGIEKDYSLAGIKHPFRQCTYEEYFAVFYSLKEINAKQLKQEYNLLKEAGFPKNYGMYEANIIFRKHGVDHIEEQCEEWWRLFLRYTKRDQLSYAYTLWKRSIPFCFLMPSCGIQATSKDPYKVVLHATHLNLKKKAMYVLFSLVPKRWVEAAFYYYLSH